MESVLSFHLLMDSRDQNQVTRLLWNASSSAKLSHQLKPTPFNDREEAAPYRQVATGQEALSSVFLPDFP